MIDSQRNQSSWWRQLWIWVCLCALTAHGEPKVLDRVVASIGQGTDRKVIALSQLEFEARVLLIAAGGVQAAVADLDHQALESSLRAVIDQRLALREADKLDTYPLEAGELEKAIASFRTKFESEERFAQFLARHEADLNELGEVLRRSLRAQRALEGKLKLRAQVSEGEAKAWKAEHAEFKDVPLDAVRARLVQQKFGELVKKELADQRKQVDVRLLGPFSPQQAPP